MDEDEEKKQEGGQAPKQAKKPVKKKVEVPQSSQDEPEEPFIHPMVRVLTNEKLDVGEDNLKEYMTKVSTKMADENSFLDKLRE